MLTLYSYFRSSTAYRVRIALNLKGLAHEIVPVNLLDGAHLAEDYTAVNPMKAVPALADGDFILTQSLAILNYLDSVAPEPPLAGGDAREQAYVRQIALVISTDIHPLTNLRVLKYLAAELGAGDDVKNKWYAHWAAQGMQAVETLLAREGRTGDFCCGDTVSVADLCLVPQMYNMRRYNLPLDGYPLCRRIEANCMRLKAFQDASPEMQPDAPAGLAPIHGPDAPLS